MEIFLEEAKELTKAIEAFEDLNKAKHIGFGRVEVMDSNGEPLGYIVMEPDRVTFRGL